jgi:iron complex outermembrane receptor protein
MNAASIRFIGCLCPTLWGPCAAFVFGLPAAHAQVQRGEPVVVTATRTEADSFNVPASIDRVEGDAIRAGRLQINLSESLGVVPGLALQNRQNYAQDLQLSIRGFGARSTFGIRGVRLYVDGIPATQPDGQGQLTNIDLSSVDHIEVLRGPFSALYGNSSGGVVQTFTEEGGGATRIVPSFAAGTDSTLRVSLKAIGAIGDTRSEGQLGSGFVVSTSHFETDGSRDHSAARRDLANAKLTFRPDAKTTFTLIANAVDLPRAQDPLGLTRAQFERDPKSVDPSALQFDTRKTFQQKQAGAIVEHELDDDNRVRVLVYGGARTTQQFQSIPVASQTPITSPGGVIDLERNYVGTDLRYTHRMRLADQPLTIVAGFAADRLDEHRKGYENFSGPASSRTLGVQGNLRRDEDNDVRNIDEYLQASWNFAPRWSLDAGVRHSIVRFASNDHFVVTTPAGTNPDDSGRVRYQATLPVAGLVYRATDTTNLYATAGRGFETPTFNELAYRPDGATGLNFGLKPAKSTNLEAGVKTRLMLASGSSLRGTAAIFSTRTRDEIVTLSNVGGRSTFTNAGRTQRRGAELSAEWIFASDWHLQAAYTLLDAHYRDAFATCNATPCAKPTLLIPSGNRIPGVAGNSADIELAYAPQLGWRAGLEARHAGKVYVDDANSDAAARYAILNARVGYLWKLARWSLETFARVDNLTDRRYAGSVIVNEGNARYFEPAQGRTVLVGATVSVSFD